MPGASQRSSIAKTLVAGRVVSALVVLMLLADSFAKIMQAMPVRTAQAELGFPDPLTVTIGVVLFVCTCVYAIPRTGVLGAILLTGYLGGAVAVKLGRFPRRPGPVSGVSRHHGLGWTFSA